MRVILLLAALVAAGPALAGDNVSQSDSNSVSNSQSGSVANTSNAMNVTNMAPEQQTVTYAGDYKVRSAPGTVLGGFSGSFSSDYCAGTAQVGASWLGGSLGLGKQVADKNCEALRRVERFGQLAASVGTDSALGRKLVTMATFELCTTDPKTTEACKKLGLVVDKEE